MNPKFRYTLNTSVKIFFVSISYIIVTVILSISLLPFVHFQLAIAIPAILFGTLYLSWLIPIWGSVLESSSGSDDQEPPSEPTSTAEEQSHEPQNNSEDDNTSKFTIWHYGYAVLVSFIAFVIMFFIFDADNLNILNPNISSSFQLENNTINGEVYPPFLLHDELTHYFYARDTLGNLTDNSYSLQSFGWEQFIQLASDEWGRPGNTLIYTIPSRLGFMERRFLALAFLILTSTYAILIAQSLVMKEDKLHSVYRRICYILVPLFLWAQPWYFYYGAQSLTQVPFMFFLTIAVFFWLNGRYAPAAFFFGLMPLTRHESLPLLFIWIIYLYRKPLFIFFRNLAQTIIKDDTQTKLIENKEPELRSRWKYILFMFFPYILWNAVSLAYRNDAPFRSLYNSTGEAAYQAQNFTLFFTAALEWMGPFVAFVFITSSMIAGILAYMKFQTWLKKFQISLDNDPEREARLEAKKSLDNFLFSADKKDETNILSRHIWWLFYFTYFVIHILIIIRPDNPYASGGYDFFILPIAPALAIISALIVSLIISWIFVRLLELLGIGSSEGRASSASTEASTSPDSASRTTSRSIDWATLPIIITVFIIGVILFFTLDENLEIWLKEAELDQKWFNPFIAWIPEGQIVDFDGTNDTDGTDDEQHRADALEREIVAEHVDGINQLVSDLSNLINNTETEENETEFIPFVLTTNSLLRYALEQASEPLNEDSILEINKTTFRLCPAKLWDVNPNLPLYPNLFPSGTVMVLDGRPDAGFQTNYMVSPESNDGYALEIHHLSTAFNDYRAYFGIWDLHDESYGEVEEDFNPNSIHPRDNFGLVVYQASQPNIADNDLRSFNVPPQNWQQAYANRYCGYAEDERFVEVTTHYQAIYPQVSGLFLETNDALSNLDVPSEGLTPILNCSAEQAMDDISECETSVIELGYVENAEGNLQSVSLPDEQTALFVPPQSFMPVLECHPIENRLQASWCLVVFADTAFAIDAESELSYTNNTLAHLMGGSTPSEQVCNYNRASSEEAEENVLDELRILPDVRRNLLLRSSASLSVRSVAGIRYANYSEYMPRWSSERYSIEDRANAETDAVILSPGCFGWVLVNRPGSSDVQYNGNAVLLNETLEDLRRDSLPVPSVNLTSP